MNLKIKRGVLIGLILIWMIVIFVFSHQGATESDETSGTIVDIIINIFHGTENLSIEQKGELSEIYSIVVRKAAHYSMYALGGIIIVSLMNTYEITDKKKIAYAQLLGSVYAMTDEFHQYFILGRSAEFRDVFLDSLGVCTGLMIGILIYKLRKHKKSK